MAVILLSGGLDSAVNLALAAREGKAALCLTVRYGQRAEEREVEAGRALAEHYSAEWQELDLRWLGRIHSNALTRPSSSLPQPSTQDLDSLERSQDTMRAVWVANRNGVFLNMGAAFAEARGLSEVYTGFNLEEATTFPDNSQAFLDALNVSLSYSTLNQVRVRSYTTDWNKTRILEEALAIGLPLDQVWSCYEPGPERCWKCESCKRSERALLAAGARGETWLAKMGWNRG